MKATFAHIREAVRRARFEASWNNEHGNDARRNLRARAKTLLRLWRCRARVLRPDGYPIHRPDFDAWQDPSKFNERLADQLAELGI